MISLTSRCFPQSPELTFKVRKQSIKAETKSMLGYKNDYSHTKNIPNPESPYSSSTKFRLYRVFSFHLSRVQQGSGKHNDDP